MDKEILIRHNLLFLKDNRKKIEGLFREDLEVLKGIEYKKIPAILKKQDSRDSKKIDIGYSMPVKVEGVRIRKASTTDESMVEDVLTPYDVIIRYLDSYSGSGKEVVEELLLIPSTFTLGIYGSLALSMVTGLGYFGEGSDIDILLRCDEITKSSIEELEKFVVEVERIEDKYRISIDMEIYIVDGYFTKVKDLLSRGKTVILKGLYDVQLVEKVSIIK